MPIASADVVALPPGASGAALPRGVGIVDALAAAIGPAPARGPAVPAPDRPSEAVAAFAAAAGRPLDRLALERLAPLDAAPADLGVAFTRTMGALVVLGDAAAAVPSGFVPADPAVGRVLAARQGFLEATVELQAAVEAARDAGELPPLLAAFPPVYAFDLAGVPSTYTTDLDLVIDVGGDDVYHNNAGGSGAVISNQGACQHADDTEDFLDDVTAVIDLAGSDEYGDPAAPRSCGVNGGAFSTGRVRVAMIVDAGGDDTYTAGDGGVNGGALAGPGLAVGLILDASGADRYVAGSVGTDGGGYGALGVAAGALVDVAGEDTYIARAYGTIGGGAGALGLGAGALVDAGGDDTYAAGQYGTIGGTWGPLGAGSGLLVEGSGDDAYRVDCFPGTAIPCMAGPTCAFGLFCGDAGTFGGAGTPVLTLGPPPFWIPLGAGLATFADLSGCDTYRDHDGTTATDPTHMSRGVLGDQIDAAVWVPGMPGRPSCDAS